jgi:hypothetical protein
MGLLLNELKKSALLDAAVSRRCVCLVRAGVRRSAGGRHLRSASA